MSQSQTTPCSPASAAPWDSLSNISESSLLSTPPPSLPPPDDFDFIPPPAGTPPAVEEAIICGEQIAFLREKIVKLKEENEGLKEQALS